MQTKLKAILMALAILLPARELWAQAITGKIDALMIKAHEAGKFDGAILVANQQGIVYKQGFGKASIETGSPNQPNTPFYIASVSKPFTALLIMQLIQSGKIKTDDTLARFFPGLKNEPMRKVTIHQLLSHSSGIPEFVEESIPSEKTYTREWFTQKLNQLVLDSTAGKKFRYCNSTYILLAGIIEEITGKSYAKNLDRNIFTPSGMRHSAGLTTGKKIKNIAKGHIMKDSTLANARSLNPAIFPGAGSIYSTIEDLYLFDRALYTDSLINGKYKEMMFSSQVQGSAYGYGWFNRKTPVGKVVYHEGDLPGYTCILFRAIEKKYCIVLLSNNQSNDKYKQDITFQIARMLNEE